MRRRTVVLAILNAAVLTAAVLSVPSPAGATTVLTGPLNVVGNRIVDAHGATVVLRGLQRDGTEGGPSTSRVPVTADELGWIGTAHAGSWNAGVVRIPVGSAQWTGACPTLANDAVHYQAAIDAEVNALTAQGIVALIDLHTVTAGCSSIDRHAMPDAPVTQTFWRDAARHYAANPLVAFELYNEPHYVSDSVWLSGTTAATVQDCDTTQPRAAIGSALVLQMIAQQKCALNAPRYQAVGMQELYEVVTAAAPNHLVVVDGPGYASSPSALRINADHGELVYALHPYTCPVPGDSCDVSAGAVANTTVLDRWKPVAAQAPVLATEMGWPVYASANGAYIDGANYYRQTIAYLDQQSPQWGFVAFAFDGGSTGAFSLLTDTTNYQPNSTGQPVFDRLHQP